MWPTKSQGTIPSSLHQNQAFRPSKRIIKIIDGRKIAFDVSVTSPTQEAVVHQAAHRPAAAIDARKQAKMRSHHDNCRGQGIFFQPLVVETFGGWDADALGFLKELARQDARRWGKDSVIGHCSEL